MSPNVPFFVYGTLRPGEGNYSWSLKGNTTREERATLTGGAMYNAGGFPYVIRDESADTKVVGEVCWVTDEAYAEVESALNHLEGYYGPGYRNHYDRESVTVTLDSGEQVQALVYLVPEHNKKRIVAQCDLIASGDWLNRGRDSLDDWVDEYYLARG